MYSFLSKVKSFLENKIGPLGFASRLTKKCIVKYQHLATGKLIDLGCGKKPFEKFFKNIDSYYGVDVLKESKADLVCDILNSDLDSNIADSVLSTLVIEHVKEPNKLISEISRISKPGATCVLVAPLIARVHGHPHDYFRFTKFGLEYLFKKNNFQIMIIEEVGGFYFTIIYLTIFYLREKIGILSYFINPFIMLPYFFLKYLDRIDKNKNTIFSYVVIAKKKG